MITTDRLTTGEDEDVTEAVRFGPEAAFAAMTERHRHELRIHCYRMLGNLDDAEDLVQETFIRAWRSRGGFEGRATFRAWLYRIATNASLDMIKQKRRRVRTVALTAGDDRSPSFDEVPWLQPFPDAFLDAFASSADDLGDVVVAKETIELAFLAAIQHLGPRSRAVLILRDILGWSAIETANALDGSVAAVNSALQRSRGRLQELGRPGRLAWSPVTAPTDAERVLVQRYMDAHALADAHAVVELLGPDVRFSMPPERARYEGREAVTAFFVDVLGVESPGDWHLVPVRANGQPAAANYVRNWGETEFRAITLDVLRFDRSQLVEITTFGADVFASFGLPDTLDPTDDGVRR